KGKLFFRSLFYLLAVLNLVDEDLSGLETWNEMLFDHECGVARDVSGYFPLPFFVDKTSKAPYVNIITVSHGILDDTKKCLHRCGNVSLVHSGLFCDFVDYICFSHCAYFLVQILREAKFSLPCQN